MSEECCCCSGWHMWVIVVITIFVWRAHNGSCSCSPQELSTREQGCSIVTRSSFVARLPLGRRLSRTRLPPPHTRWGDLVSYTPPIYIARHLSRSCDCAITAQRSVYFSMINISRHYSDHNGRISIVEVYSIQTCPPVAVNYNLSSLPSTKELNRALDTRT